MRLFLLLLAALLPLAAQTITGTIVGNVQDPSSLPVAGAAVILTNAATAIARDAHTDAQGDFRFTIVPQAPAS